jgi:bacterioferritin-associated ferredoxin
MDSCSHTNNCHGCPARLVCRCLGVTEDIVVAAISTLGLASVQDVRQCTGAGDGCTCCHARLREYLERYSPSSASALAICSVK